MSSAINDFNYKETIVRRVVQQSALDTGADIDCITLNLLRSPRRLMKTCAERLHLGFESTGWCTVDVDVRAGDGEL